jgi:PAS domain S-box-containing protein
METAPVVSVGSVFLFQVLGQVLLMALVAVVLHAFYRIYHRHYLVLWARAWLAFTVYAAGATWGAFLSGYRLPSRALPLALSTVVLVAGYAQIFWLLLGTWELAGRRDASRRLSQAAFALAVLVGVTSVFVFAPDPASAGRRELLRLSVRWSIAGTAYLAGAVAILWSAGSRPATFGRRFMGIALGGYGLEQFAYVALSLGSGAVRGYVLVGTFDIVAQAFLALAVVVWLLEDERERVIRAIRETHRRQRAQACVYRISEAARSVRDLPALFRSIHEGIGEVLPARNFYIALLDRESGLVEFPYFVDEYDPPPAPKPLGRGLTEYVLRSRQPLLASPEVFRDLVARGEVELIASDSVDWLGVPLLVAGEAIGVLAIQTYDPAMRLGLEERDLLVFVSEQVAAAIEAKRVEEALRLGEARLRQVIDLVPHFIFAKDVEGRFLLVNRAVAEAYGTTVEALLGRTDADFARSPEEARHFREDDLEVIGSGRPKVVPEEPITDASGRVRYLQTTKIPFTFSGSASPAILGVSLDITERKASEEALRRAAKEESLAVLAGGVAHDFNNLLAAMLGHLSLALKKLPPESSASPHVEKAASTVQRAADLTRQMLAYSGRGHFVIRAADLGALVRENLPLLQVALPKNVRLEARISDDLPPVDADVGQIQQVLMNLVINGAEAIGERGGTVTVTADLQPVGPHDERFWRTTSQPLAPGVYVLLEVRDDGPGMDDETLSRIFDPFFSTKFTGRGLGLAAVLGIVKGHRGGLSVESEPGRGTVFRLLFVPSREVPGTRPPAPAATGRDRLRLLLIDDEQIVREMVAEVLLHEGFEVVVAGDGEEGVALLRKWGTEVDVVLLDLSMPGLGGEETFARLSAVHPDIPVILSSGYDRAEATRRFEGRAPSGFIQKPYRPEELLAEIRRCVRGPAN